MLAEVPPRVAVTVTVSIVLSVPTEAENEAVVAPAVSTTVAGTVTEALLSEIVTVVFEEGAALTVTVHALVILDTRLDGPHTTEVTLSAGRTVTDAVWELLPNVAVTITGWELLTAPAVAVKVALAAPAGTVIDAGMVTEALLSLRETAVLTVVALLSVTVHVAVLLDAILLGLHVRPLTEIAGVTVRDAVLDVPDSVAERTAV